MSGVGLLLLVTVQAQPLPLDSLVLLAERASVTELEERAAVAPMQLRDAVRVLLARSVREVTPDEQARALEQAGRLARAHRAAWDDDFLVRSVERHAGDPVDRRRARIAVDSLRREGSAVYGRLGFADALPLWRESLRRATELHDTAAVAAAIGNLGVGFLNDGALDSAEVHLTRARSLAIAAGDRLVEGNAVGTLAQVSLDRGDLAAARERFDEAQALRRRIGDTRGAAMDLNNLGNLAWKLGDLKEAAARYRAALELNRGDGREDVAATNLVNLAGLASVAGDFERASSLYREALRIYEDAELWRDAADVLRGLGQLEMRRGDYPAAMESLGRALQLYDRTGGSAERVAVRRDLVGSLAGMGRLQAAVDSLRVASKLADELDVTPGVRAELALARADLAVTMNMMGDAERAYALAERLYAEAGDGDGQAHAWHGQGLVLLERDDFRRADELLANAARAQDASGDLRSAAVTRVVLAEARWKSGDADAARRLLRDAAGTLRAVEDPVSEAWALAEHGDREREAGLPRAADSLYAAALAGLGSLQAPDVRWRLHFGRGLTARSDGALDVAVSELEAAVEVIEGAAQTLALPERRSAYRADKAEAYVQLALSERMRGRTAPAFEASERMRARQTLESLVRGRMGRRPDVAGELMGRAHDLRVRIGELTAEAEPTAPGLLPYRGPDPATPSAPAREALAEARRDYAALLLEMRERAPREAALLAPSVASWRDVADRLGPAEAMIEYLVSDSGSVAFVLTPDTVAALDLGITRRDLARLVEFTRGLLDRPASSTDASWRSPLRRLHDHLVRPAEESGLLAGATSLVLVPHAELHYLPFSAMIDESGRFLVERYALSTAPSASVWAALADRPRSRGRSTLALAPRPEALPASGREAASVARLAGAEATLLTGSSASEDRFRRSSGSYRELHVATYGVLNQHNPLFSFVDMAAGGGHDGRLEVHEVYELQLNADLVVLSACQTALGSGAIADVPAGDDWIGLTRAFLHAGAAKVVATLWAVEDRATADLMELFYRNRAGDGDDARALAAAQRAMLRDASTAHPFHWAGVVLVGGARLVGEP